MKLKVKDEETEEWFYMQVSFWSFLKIYIAATFLLNVISFFIIAALYASL